MAGQKAGSFWGQHIRNVRGSGWCAFGITWWENGQLLTSLIHGWVTALLAFTWSPLSRIFDRLLNEVCLKFLFNISKTLIQQDASAGVPPCHQISSCWNPFTPVWNVFISAFFFICDNSKANRRLKLCLIQHLHVWKQLLIAACIRGAHLQAWIPRVCRQEDLKSAVPAKHTLPCSFFLK